MVAYTYATIMFLIITLFNKAARERTNRFLNVSNGLILIVLFLNLIIVVNNTLSCSGYSLSCYHFLLWSISLGFIFQLSFFYKRCRTSVMATIISLVMLFALNNLEKIYLFITTFFRDYLPSGWSFFYADSEQLWTLLISSVYFAFCWKISSSKAVKEKFSN